MPGTNLYCYQKQVAEIPNKGRGILASKHFSRGNFVVQYAGDLIDNDEATRRTDNYSKVTNKGCYMYYFNFKNKKYWYVSLRS